MTKNQLLARYGNIELVDDLIRRKVADGEVRPHHEFPGNADMTLYRCWDSTTYDSDDEVEESTTMSSTGELDKEGVQNLAKSGMFDRDNVRSLSDGTQASSNTYSICTARIHIHCVLVQSPTACTHVEIKTSSPYG